MPLLVVGVMAIVELGLLISNLQHVEFASRNGAIVAAKLPRASLPIAPAAMPVEITTAVVAELQKMNPAITSATIRQVYLEHTADPGGAGPLLVPETITDGASLAPIPYLTVTDPSAAPTLNAYEYVRVTVFVDFSDIAPNLLSTFCIDFSTAVVQQTSTMPYLQP